MKKKIATLIALLLPSSLACVLLRFLGYKIGKSVKIGFSIIKCDNITLLDDSRIGHFNLILNKSIKLEAKSYIGYMNVFKGPFTLELKEKAAIGNKNYFTRGIKGITYGQSKLSLGILTKITTGHHIDLTRSISFGDFSILAGIRSQLWTHGYYHASQGPERIRIDGEIQIGNNVYVGSGCIFNPGVKVSSTIHIGAGSVISKNLKEPGMYIGQVLRYIDNDLEKIKAKLTEVKDDTLIETVYKKN